jgi:hypothetical protein
MSIASMIVDKIAAGSHKEAQQLIDQLPEQVRTPVQHLSNALAKATAFIPGVGGGSHVSPGGTAGSPNAFASFKAGPPRPRGVCGIPKKYLNALNRRPFQYQMMVTLLASTSIPSAPAGGVTTTTDFVLPLGTYNAKSGCAMIVQSNIFPNWFVSTVATMTISLSGGPTSGSGSPQLAESQARLDQLEISEWHAGREVARYPLRDFHPQIERYVSDGTGSATTKDHLDGPGVLFPQLWSPLTGFNMFISNQGPAWTPTNDINLLLTLKGSIGAECATGDDQMVTT